MLNRTILFLGLTFCSSFLVQNQAKSAAHCEELTGQVLFRDAMYGTGLGAVGTSLYILATESYTKPGKKIAGGSLLGFGVGVGLGILELSMRDCDSSWKTFTMQPLLFEDKGWGTGVTLAYRF